MKPALLFLFLAMAGCSTFSREQLAAYNDRGIPPALCARMQSHGKLSPSDVAGLSRIGMRSGEIITYLAFSGSEFNLSPQDVEDMRKEGVSGDVITYMRENPNKTGGLFSMF